MINHPDFEVFKVNQCFLVISPVLLAIVEYITLSKLLAISASLYKAGSNQNPAATLAKHVAWWFTASDVICCLLQGSGGALYTNPNFCTTCLLQLFHCPVGVRAALPPFWLQGQPALQVLASVPGPVCHHTPPAPEEHLPCCGVCTGIFWGPGHPRELPVHIRLCTHICMLLVLHLYALWFWLGPNAIAVQTEGLPVQQKQSLGGAAPNVLHVHCS